MPWPRLALPSPTIKAANSTREIDAVEFPRAQRAAAAPLHGRNGQRLAEERLRSPDVLLAVKAARDLVLRQPSFADAAFTAQLQRHALRNPAVVQGLFFALLHAAATNPSRAARRGIVFMLANLDNFTRHIERKDYTSFADSLRHEYSYKARKLTPPMHLIVGTCTGLGKGGRSLGPSLPVALKKLL